MSQLQTFHQTDYPSSLQHACFPDLFEAIAEKMPSNKAVLFEDDYLSYQELNTRANQLAHYLQSLGVGPDTYVGLYTEPSLDTMVGLLAILKAGGAYVPLDASYPPERLTFMIEETGLSIVLTLSSLSHFHYSHDVHWIPIDTNQATLMNQSTLNPRRHITPDNLSYVIFTSGSTGQAKGVEIIHRGFVNVLLGSLGWTGISPHDVLIQTSNLCFDASVFELFLPLVAGAAVRLLPAKAKDFGPEFIATLMRPDVTIMLSTPSVYQLLLKAKWQGKPTLKLMSVGELLPRELANQLLGMVESVWDLYGPTETTVITSATQIFYDTQPIAIKQWIANTKLVILNDDLSPVPEGVPGELHIGGLGLARGYLNRPDLTAEQFITLSSERWYKSGDLAKYTPSGDIEILGRVDSQVKIRGIRLELKEVEVLLNNHPSIDQSAVIVTENKLNEKCLVACVVPLQNVQLTSSALHHYLLQKLPWFMVPTKFILMPTLPLNTNGKVDRTALTAQCKNEFHYERDRFPLFYSAIGLLVLEVWSSILNVYPIDPSDNFFELGGHSISAIQMLAQLQKHLKKTIPIDYLFKHPTLHEFITALDSGEDLTTKAVMGINTDGIKPPIFGFDPFFSLPSILGATQPFYYLRGAHTHITPSHTPIQALIKIYLDEILTIQPNPPYYITAHCATIVLAIELARQLRALNKDATLIIFDPPPINGPETIVYWLAYHTKRALLSYAKWYPKNILKWIYNNKLMQFYRIQEDQKDEFNAFYGSDPRFEGIPIDCFKQYNVKRIPAKFIAFLAKDDPTELIELIYRRKRWLKKAEQAEFFLVDGDHNSIFSGNGIQQIADILSAKLG